MPLESPLSRYRKLCAVIDGVLNWLPHRSAWYSKSLAMGYSPSALHICLVRRVIDRSAGSLWQGPRVLFRTGRLIHLIPWLQEPWCIASYPWPSAYCIVIFSLLTPLTDRLAFAMYNSYTAQAPNNAVPFRIRSLCFLSSSTDLGNSPAKWDSGLRWLSSSEIDGPQTHSPKSYRLLSTPNPRMYRSEILLNHTQTWSSLILFTRAAVWMNICLELSRLHLWDI